MIDELVAIGFARVTDYFYVRDGQLQSKVPPEETGDPIASMESTTKGVKVKFYDKLKALELLGKHLGLFGTREEPPQLSGDDQLLQAILQATREEVDVHDLPELQQAADAGHDLVEPSGSG